MKKDTMIGKLSIIRQDLTGLDKIVRGLKITSSPTMVSATELLTKIVSRKKRIEELRLFFTRPLNEQVNAINKEFKSVGTPFAEMEIAIKDKMVAYRKIEAEKLEKKRKKEEEKKRKEWEKEQEKLRKQREKEAEKERKKLEALNLSKREEKKHLKEIEEENARKEEEANREEFDFDDDDFQQSKSVHTDNGSIKVRKQWTFEIKNPGEIPREYLIVDEKLIRKAIKEGKRSIKGVDIFEKEIIGASA